MMDIIVSWPRNCDYPVWREFIRNNRNLFQNVIIVFTDTFMGDDYMDFVKTAMVQDNISFCHSHVLGDKDWRNEAVNTGLKYSFADWIWFTEQDFFIIDHNFWVAIGAIMERADCFGVFEGERLHPCCLFIKRELLDKTMKNFGVLKDRLDHFGLIQRDLTILEVKIHRVNPDSYLHFGGLSHNFRLINEGHSPNYHKKQFRKYIEQSLKVGVPIDPRYRRICKKYLNRK